MVFLIQLNYSLVKQKTRGNIVSVPKVDNQPQRISELCDPECLAGADAQKEVVIAFEQLRLFYLADRGQLQYALGNKIFPLA